MNTPPRILFVDDEEKVLKALQRHFLHDDYEVMIALSGKEGLALFEQYPFDVVISDFRMPEMNGGEFLKLVMERWPETIRLVLSGYADISSVITAINEGEIFKFISKPWKDGELKEAVQEAVKKHRAMMEMRMLAEQALASTNLLFESELHERQFIIERNLALEENSSSLGRYQQIFELLETPILIFDPDGNVVELNPAALHTLMINGIEVEGPEYLTENDLPLSLRNLVREAIPRPTITLKQTILWGSQTFEVMARSLLEGQRIRGVFAFLWPQSEETALPSEES